MMSTQAPQILGFIRHATSTSNANTRFAQQRCNWSQVGIIQQSTMGTNTDEIFRLNLNTPLTAQNAINIFGLSTDSSPEQLAKLQQSDLFNSFWNVNQGTPYIDDPRDVLIPGKESIHGREVFTLYDDGNPTTKLFGNSNGKMRYFDAQTGKELYTWLPKGVNIRDTEKVRPAMLQRYENSRTLSSEDKLEILQFYAFNNINGLSDREQSMISNLEKELRVSENKFEYKGCSETTNNQINSFMINVLTEKLNAIKEVCKRYPDFEAEVLSRIRPNTGGVALGTSALRHLYRTHPQLMDELLSHWGNASKYEAEIQARQAQLQENY